MMEFERLAHLDGHLVFVDAGTIGAAKRTSIGIVYDDGSVQLAWPSDGSRPQDYRERAMHLLWQARGQLNGRTS